MLFGKSQRPAFVEDMVTLRRQIWTIFRYRTIGNAFVVLRMQTGQWLDLLIRLTLLSLAEVQPRLGCGSGFELHSVPG